MQGSRATRLGSRESQANVRYPHGSSCTLWTPCAAPGTLLLHRERNAASRSACQQVCPPASPPARLGSPTGPATPWPALLTLRPPRERLPWPPETLPALSSSYLCLPLQLWGALLAAINQVWTRAAPSGQQVTVAAVLTLMT